MYKDAEAKFGKGAVAMSDAATKESFSQDWGDMAGNCITEVNINYHGNNQTLMLDSKSGQYITATGDGKSNLSNTPSMNVKELPEPKGNVMNAQLNINSCKSNSHTQYPLKGERLTLMESFYDSSSFKTIRGTSYGVSYGRLNKHPFPGHSWKKGTWDYKRRYQETSNNYPGIGLPPK